MVDVEGIATRTTTNHVTTALQAVATIVFPCCALELQRQWMQQKMHKPADLPTQQMAAAINRLNNSLPLFPLGSTESKFCEKEIVGLLEWLLPQFCKFNLDGYVPFLHSKMSCEAIEKTILFQRKFFALITIKILRQEFKNLRTKEKMSVKN
jgi:hypothetical protein